MRNFVVATAAALFIGVVACGEADPYGDLDDPKTDKTDTASTAAGSCASAIEGQDPEAAKLTSCTGTKGSKGHCVPKSKLATFGDTFEKAGCKDDEACLPDELIKKGSKIELKKCNAVTNIEGRCFWPLAKDIVTNYDLLKGATKDQCDPDMVCAPCTNPLTGKTTGVCALGGGGDCKKGGGDAPASSGGGAKVGKCPQVEPILDASIFPAEDCGSGMVCVGTELIPDPKLAGSLKKCSKGVCAPKKSVERGGGYVPKTCKSLAGAEGRCSNVSIPQIASQKAMLPQADCDADERCAPCFDPRTGAETGACSQASCDKPKEPAKKFASCCGGRATCVPASAVPGDSASSLGADTCTGDTPLCAPNEFVGTAKPRACSAAFGLSKGVCLSQCTVAGFMGKIGAVFLKGECGDDELCAPCSKLPAGTEGCK